MTPAGSGSSSRLTSIDAWRGLIMVIMALDHVRDFIHVGAMSGSPEDLATTTPILFFTRWITHFCAPVFMFSAGAGAFLKLQRDGSKARLSWFLFSRGVWLVLLELTAFRVALNFNLDLQYPVLLVVLWALGMCMVVLAALVHLPMPAIAAVSAVLILGHNAFDGIRAAQWGEWAWLWNVLHQQGVFIVSGVPVVIAYPLVPWIGVMAAGFCFGPVMLMTPAERQRVLIRSGLILIAGFFILRTFNLYGDPSHWATQASGAMSVVSFFRATKYPPSLVFLLMTMGPALLLLAWIDRRDWPKAHPLAVIGRVPLFYFVVHFWLSHVAASVLAFVSYGSASLAWLFMPLPSSGGPADKFPPDFGYPLWGAYLVWITVVLVMYPLCRWFGALKSRQTGWWWGYL